MGSILGIVEFFESEGWRKLKMDFSGDRVLITGASRGIGRACTLAFA